jgi:hypothetical protein
MGALAWDAARRGWVDRNGRALTERQVLKLRDDLAIEVSRILRQETQLYLDGKLEFDSWVRNFEDMLVRGTGSGYAFGRGGVGNMTDGDYDRLARIYTQQSEFFAKFVADVQTGDMSDEKLLARADLYGGSAVNAFEQAKQQAAIGDSEADWDLPFYPADGDTPCRSNCRCSWVIEEDATGWTCAWVTERDEQVCDGCAARGELYGESSPLVIPKPYGEQREELAA